MPKSILYLGNDLNPQSLEGLSLHRLTSTNIWPKVLEEEPWNLVLVQDGFLNKTSLDWLEEARKSSYFGPIVLLLPFKQTIRYSEYVDRGWSDVIFPDEIFRLNFIIERERVLGNQRKIRELNTHFLEHSLLELQYQKIALDQATSVSITDSNGVITSVNLKFQKNTGFGAKDLIGQTHEVLSTEKFGKSFWGEIWNEIKQGKMWKGEVHNKRKDGSLYWEDLTIVPFYGKDGTIFQYMFIHFDISDRKIAEDQLIHDAFHDSLSGLPNRALLLARIEQKIADFVKNKSGRPVLISMNLDNFKRINNSLGYEFGDKVLIQFAKRLQEFFGKDTVVSHLTADHFAVLNTAFLDEDEAFRFTIQVQEKLKETTIGKDYELFLTSSSGIASYGLGGNDGEEMLRNAEIAMFQSKAEGIGLTTRYSHEMKEKIRHQLEVQNDLKKGINRGEFLVFLQPIYSLGEKKISHWEALIRWRHPKKGMVSPLDFIPLAESSGLILPLTRFVMDQAAKFISMNGIGAGVAINLSSTVFRDLNVLQCLKEVANTHKIPISLLQIEITESIAIQNFEATLPQLNDLRELGIKVSLDDFGTGFSSLSYLQELPLDILKIDKSFLEEIDTTTKKKDLLRSIITMAHDLNLEVVTEGVEDIHQFELLNNLGCDLVQGYFLSKPLPMEEAVKFDVSKFLNLVP